MIDISSRPNRSLKQTCHLRHRLIYIGSVCLHLTCEQITIRPQSGNDITGKLAYFRLQFGQDKTLIKVSHPQHNHGTIHEDRSMFSCPCVDQEK